MVASTCKNVREGGLEDFMARFSIWTGLDGMLY